MGNLNNFVYFLVQKIDGFLAVLCITGGNFAPQSQKLPFSVNSMDGDCFLLYFSSIDLAGCSSSIKSGSQKSKRGIGSDDSRTVKSRLRIPMKGRIQLVLGWLQSSLRRDDSVLTYIYCIVNLFGLRNVIVLDLVC